MAPAVAQRIGTDGVRRGRTIDERAVVRFPLLYARIARVFARLSPRVRLRQRLLVHQVLSGWAASSREDFDLMVIRYAPDVVYEYNPELVTLGLPARVEGRDAFLAAIRDFLSVWGDWHYTLRFVIDLGDRLITLGSARLRGEASGLDLDIDYAQVMDHRDGLVSHERDFTDWSEALGAAGVDPAVLSRLRALGPGAVMELPAD